MLYRKAMLYAQDYDQFFLCFHCLLAQPSLYVLNIPNQRRHFEKEEYLQKIGKVYLLQMTLERLVFVNFNSNIKVIILCMIRNKNLGFEKENEIAMQHLALLPLYSLSIMARINYG